MLRRRTQKDSHRNKSRVIEVRPRLRDHLCTSTSFPTEHLGYRFSSNPATPTRKYPRTTVLLSPRTSNPRPSNIDALALGHDLSIYPNTFLADAAAGADESVIDLPSPKKFNSRHEGSKAEVQDLDEFDHALAFADLPETMGSLGDQLGFAASAVSPLETSKPFDKHAIGASFLKNFQGWYGDEMSMALSVHPTTPRRGSNILMTPRSYHNEASVNEAGDVGERKDASHTIGSATRWGEWDLASEVESLGEKWGIDDEMGFMIPRRARRVADDLLLELRVLDTIRARTESRRQRILRAGGHTPTKPTQGPRQEGSSRNDARYN